MILRFALRALPVLILLLPCLTARGAGKESHPVYARKGMVVAVEANAAEAGLEMLRAGGNAFDAAAAVGYALAVTYPQAGNLGGGGFVVALKADGTALALDMRETAPAGAHRDMYLDEKGNVIGGLSLDSHLAVGVPGMVDGLLKLQADHGVLTREAVLAPAIRLAEEGFEVSHTLHTDLKAHESLLTKYPATRAIFFPEGAAAGYGDRLRQADLGRTLRRIARDGRAGFYEGLTADMIVEEMRRGGGIVTAEDLRGYEAKYREPLRSTGASMNSSRTRCRVRAG
jgi:gamma-glutamyltranspeptidase / glutathione hydrolase